MDPRHLHHPRYPSLADYGLIGDGHSAALVSSEGSIDWWCPARFDAPSVFARLLDWAKGGHFHVGMPVRHKRHFEYVPRTNVLRTRFETSDACVALTTFMPHAEAATASSELPRRIIRLLECVKGPVEMTLDFAPAFDYARAPPTFEWRDGGVLAEGAGHALALSSTVPLEEHDGRVTTTFRLEDGERHALILDDAGGTQPVLRPDPLGLAQRSLDETTTFWRDWIGQCRYEGPYSDAVERSLLALKLLQHSPTGSFVAAPTCSLPEASGGGRNWDYRYSWLRDGVYIIMAFETMGFAKESHRFREWLAQVLRRDAVDGIQMLYRVDGSRELEESVLPHLEGYRRSAPVRVGNQAAEQHQLDTYGELMLCFHRAEAIFADRHREETWSAVRQVVDWVAENWREEDSGIWEMRGRHRHYVYSKAMAWLAVDHGLKVARENGFDAPEERWQRAGDEIFRYLLDEGYDEDFGAFTQATDRADADSSNLLFPILGVLEARDPRMLSTIERTRADLESHGLLHRYIVDDELPGSEGAFLVGSFWLANALTLAGDVEGARRAFDRALATAGPLGLLAEEADPVTSEPLGNYPQALTHLGLILAAYAIREAEAGRDPNRPVGGATGGRRAAARAGSR